MNLVEQRPGVLYCLPVVQIPVVGHPRSFFLNQAGRYNTLNMNLDESRSAKAI